MVDLRKDARLLDDISMYFEHTTSMWAKLKKLGLLYRGINADRNPSCGRILAHAKCQVSGFRENMGISLCVFKIGVTANPPARFVHYVEKGFTNMWVLFAGEEVGLIHMLEAALISEFGSASGCQNKLHSGGEGALNRKNLEDPPYYVYVTGGRADQPRRVG